MNPRRSVACALVALLVVVLLAGRMWPRTSGPLRAVLLDVEHCTRESLAHVSDGGASGVVLVLEASDEEYKTSARAAADAIRDRDLDLCYWIEIARDPELVQEHPELAAGLQGHDSWRIAVPRAPVAGPNELVKAWPWIPILYEAGFDLQLAKIEERLADLPPPDGLFLNDLQGGPSACGCGNTSCRWTVDYLDDPSEPLSPAPVAARFLALVRERHPETRVIPVWTGECGPEAERPYDGCHGVPCYTGRCWPALVEELRPVAEAGGSIGLLLAERVPVEPPDENARHMMSGEEYEEMLFAPVVRDLAGFPTEVAKRGFALAPERLIPVLRCWDRPDLPDVAAAQTRIAREHGAREWIVAMVPIDQSWDPRLVPREAR